MIIYNPFAEHQPCFMNLDPAQTKEAAIQFLQSECSEFYALSLSDLSKLNSILGQP